MRSSRLSRPSRIETVALLVCHAPSQTTSYLASAGPWSPRMRIVPRKTHSSVPCRSLRRSKPVRWTHCHKAVRTRCKSEFMAGTVPSRPATLYTGISSVFLHEIASQVLTSLFVIRGDSDALCPLGFFYFLTSDSRDQFTLSPSCSQQCGHL